MKIRVSRSYSRRQKKLSGMRCALNFRTYTPHTNINHFNVYHRILEHEFM